ncbi:MAG: DUF721 domain-containing protein [Deltaproteobacteria bacterium]|jgi:predicted nucleic acid-binding Zn ribbon protein|nr:DUF721 domain-containing protein [Deltaproteobacteria bacterium]
MNNPKPENDKYKPVKISRLLSTVFADKKWHGRLELHKVFEFWDRTVGKEIAAVAQPALVRGGNVLWIKVKDSIWMQQLHLQKVLLLEKINIQLKGEKFSDIRFQLDSSLTGTPEPDTVPEKRKTVLLDKKKEQEFDKLIGSLENEDLKASLKSLWVAMKTKGNK